MEIFLQYNYSKSNFLIPWSKLHKAMFPSELMKFLRSCQLKTIRLGQAIKILCCRLLLWFESWQVRSRLFHDIGVLWAKCDLGPLPRLYCHLEKSPYILIRAQHVLILAKAQEQAKIKNFESNFQYEHTNIRAQKSFESHSNRMEGLRTYS
jgi:hypothetical protein